MRAAGILSAATVALSLGACSDSGGGGGGGGGSDSFFGQTLGAEPNRDFAEFLNDAAAGEKLSITQHTGSMTLSAADAEEIVDFLFFEGPLPDLGEGGATILATADGSDENPAHFKLTDTGANDFIFRTASTGDLEMVVVVDEDDGEFDGFFLAETIDDDPDVGDDIATVRLSAPGENAEEFGELNYMSVVAWITSEEPAEDATEVSGNFGVGHMGLATPEDDIPVEGTADYHGGFAGIVVDPDVDPDEGDAGFFGTLTGDAEFTANFGLGTVEGGVFHISVTGIDLGGEGTEGSEPVGDIVFDEVTIAGNTFTGGVIPGDEGFGPFDQASTGTLDGAFYGPVEGDGPAEAGAVLTLYDATEGSGAFVTGVIGATLHIDD